MLCWPCFSKSDNYLKDFLVAQRVKNLPVMQGTQVRSLGQEDPLEKWMATHSCILAWRVPRTEEPGGLQSMGSQSIDTTEWHFQNSVSSFCVASLTSRAVGRNSGFWGPLTHFSIWDGVRRASHTYCPTRAWSTRGHRGSVWGGTQAPQATSVAHEMSQTGMKTCSGSPLLFSCSPRPGPGMQGQGKLRRA